MVFSIIDELIGKIIIKIENNNEEIFFHLSNGAIYKQYHPQNCCECVYVEDIDGDLNDLVGSILLQAEEASADATQATNAESATWTYYKFATIKGYVTIRWYGSSNGYYSEGVYIEIVKDADPIKEQRKNKLLEINKNIKK